MLDAGRSYRTVDDILGNSENTLRLHHDGFVGTAIEGRRDDVVLATKFGFISHRTEDPAPSTAAPDSIRIAIDGRCSGSAPTTSICYQHHREPDTRSKRPSERSPNSSLLRSAMAA